MNQVSFEEIGAVTATFLAKEDVVPGQVVKSTDDGAFCGLALSNRKGFAGVQVKGFMTLPISGSVSLGQVILAADGTGKVKTASTGVTALVVSVEDAAHTGKNLWCACNLRKERGSRWPIVMTL